MESHQDKSDNNGASAEALKTEKVRESITVMLQEFHEFVQKNYVKEISEVKALLEGKLEAADLQKISIHMAKLSEMDDVARNISSEERTNQRPSRVRSKSVADTDENEEDEQEEWLKLETITKVREHLKRTGQKDILHALNSAYKNLTKVPKNRDIVRKIVQFPGGGYIPLHDEDKPELISPEDYQERKDRMYEEMAKARLHGTEEIVKHFQDSYLATLEEAVAQEDEEKGDLMRDEDRAAFPVYLLQGPPGTGKTTIVEALARSFNMGYHAISLAAETDKNIIAGRGPEWEAPEIGIVQLAQLKTGRKKVIILLDEIDKASPEVQTALTDLLNGDQNKLTEKFFGTVIDKRDVMVVATANDISAFRKGMKQEHLGSRFGANIIEMGGYDKFTKIKILQDYFDRKLCRRITRVELPSEALIHFVEKYVTNPGIREEKGYLAKIFQAALVNQPDITQGAIITTELIDKIMIPIMLKEQQHLEEMNKKNKKKDVSDVDDAAASQKEKKKSTKANEGTDDEDADVDAAASQRGKKKSTKANEGTDDEDADVDAAASQRGKKKSTKANEGTDDEDADVDAAASQRGKKKSTKANEGTDDEEVDVDAATSQRGKKKSTKANEGTDDEDADVDAAAQKAKSKSSKTGIFSQTAKRTKETGKEVDDSTTLAVPPTSRKSGSRGFLDPKNLDLIKKEITPLGWEVGVETNNKVTCAKESSTDGSNKKLLSFDIYANSLVSDKTDDKEIIRAMLLSYKAVYPKEVLPVIMVPNKEAKRLCEDLYKEVYKTDKVDIQVGIQADPPTEKLAQDKDEGQTSKHTLNI